jgi:oligoendopeptidase F
MNDKSIWKKRGSEEFPRTYIPTEIDLGNWNDLEPIFKELHGRELGSEESLGAWLEDLGELQACLSEEGSRRYIAMTCHTEDPELEQAYLHFITEIEPKLKPWHDKLNRKYLESEARKELDPGPYFVFNRALENEVKLYREENVPLETEDDKLRQKYQKLCGAMTVQFLGEEKTLPQMKVYLEENDRELRQSAWEKIAERYLADREAIDSIFDEQIALRDRIAKNAGFENYRDFKHQSLGRFDYTPEDCLAFHNAVEKEIVPLNRNLAAQRKSDLGIDSLRPWDMEVDPQARPPLRPFKGGEQLAEGCARIFERIDPALGEQFAKMREMNLLDLESRKGKAPGGYQCGLDEIRYPFIFMNAAGTDRDVSTLLHEGGHAFHSFACRLEPLYDYREHVPIEFCEVASMGMELLAFPHLEEFYSEEEVERSRRKQIEDTLKVLAWIATIDAFQHWLYRNPKHTREERQAYWLELSDRFGVGIDWSGYEDAKQLSWHRQLHPFCVPLYYIEYGIAQLGALQLWLRASEDKEAAISDYRKALALGGSKALPELFSAAGLRFALDRETVAPLAEKLAGELGL